MKFLPSILVLTLMVSSCSKMKDQSAEDDQTIQNYLTAKNLIATKDPSGLYYIANVVGTGVSPTLSSTVEVKCKGTLIDGTVFWETSTDKTFTSPLNDLIKGWQIGLPLMKKGGKTTLLIPSGLGYGSANLPSIPANSVLLFEIELIDVK